MQNGKSSHPNPNLAAVYTHPFEKEPLRDPRDSIILHPPYYCSCSSGIFRSHSCRGVCSLARVRAVSDLRACHSLRLPEAGPRRAPSIFQLTYRIAAVNNWGKVFYGRSTAARQQHCGTRSAQRHIAHISGGPRIHEVAIRRMLSRHAGPNK